MTLLDPDRNTLGKFQRPGDAAETQRLAALEAYPATGSARRRVLNAIACTGNYGCTDEELQQRLGMNPSTQRPRRVELVEGGWIQDSERRRRTSSGRSAVVWVMTPAGLRQWIPNKFHDSGDEPRGGTTAHGHGPPLPAPAARLTAAETASSPETSSGGVPLPTTPAPPLQLSMEAA